MNVRASWLLYCLSTVLIIGLVGAVPQTHAQTSDRPGQLAHNLQPLATVASLQLPALNIARLRATDRQRPADAPLRFAEPARVQITPGNSGTWERGANATAVWRLHITAPNALSINLGFGRYHMPANSRLFVYTPDYRSVLGPYTAADNASHGQLWTPILPGASVVLELSGPAAEIAQIDLELSAVNQGYTAFGLPRTNAPDSGSCNVDVICPEGDIWQPEIRSVAVYTVMGMYSCTGALINNTAQDHKPLFLTAYHCVSDQSRAASVVTYWNYQSLICRTGLPSNGDGPASLPSQALSGSSLRSKLPASDFALLELDDAVPGSFNAHWAGWDRRAVEFPAVVTIHHPQGHEKRISLENDPTTTTSHGQEAIPGDGTHLRITDWDVGTTEGGSSGSPLFSPEHHIVGQLHGGYAYCDNALSDWYGRLSYSWAGGGTATTRLSDWLDPLDAGVLMLDGLDAPPDFSLDVAPAAGSLCVGASTSYTIDLSASSGYSSTVSLSAPGLPAGLTASFNPPALVPPGTSVITVSAAPSAAAGPLALTIRGTAPATSHAQTVTVTIATAIPATPPLSDPANASSGLPLRPTLSWDSVPQASDYQLELTSDANFTSIEHSVLVSATSYTPDLDLAAATLYFWRVRASNGCGTSAYSTVFQFRTAGATPLYLPLITR
jgi:hypothetical protein